MFPVKSEERGYCLECLVNLSDLLKLLREAAQPQGAPQNGG